MKEEPETTGSLPRAAHAGANPIFPLGNLLSIHSALGEEERKVTSKAVLAGRILVPPRAIPLLLAAPPQAGMASRQEGARSLLADPRRMDAVRVGVLQTPRGLSVAQQPLRAPRAPAQALRMILPGFLQSRQRSRRAECTRGREKLHGAALGLLLLGNTERRHGYCPGHGRTRCRLLKDREFWFPPLLPRDGELDPAPVLRGAEIGAEPRPGLCPCWLRGTSPAPATGGPGKGC